MDQSLQGPTGGASVDWRGLLSNLVRSLDERAWGITSPPSWAEVKAARAALAEPEREVVVPTDEELESFLVDVAAANGDIYWAEPLVLARAVLARWGHQPAPPAEGEVASPACLALKPSPELTEAFKDLPPSRIELLPEDAQVIEPTEHTILVPARTPVPVAERLPGAKDCDGEGRCWWWDGEWGLVEQRFTDYHATHWLPATALPLPQGGGGVMAYPAIGHAVMRVIAWDGVEVHGVPMQSPPDGPQRFIQVFDTEEQAVAFSINEVGMTTPNRPPLWEVMRTAYDCSTAPNGSTDDRTERDGFAAEIRAVADWIKKARPDYDEVLHGAIRADELDSILALLTAEADRAERDEQSIGQEH